MHLSALLVSTLQNSLVTGGRSSLVQLLGGTGNANLVGGSSGCSFGHFSFVNVVEKGGKLKYSNFVGKELLEQSKKTNLIII